ncbi:MAG: AraC family transcriptional regulator [Sneathiella sp.]
MKSTQQPASPATLYLWHGHSLFIGPVTDNGIHRHYALQLTLTDNAPFLITADDGSLQSQFHFSDIEVPHSLDTNGQEVAVLLIEPHSARGTQLRQQLTTSISENMQTDCCQIPLPRSSERANAYINQIDQILTSAPDQIHMSKKIERVLGYLAQNRGEPCSAKSAAEIANLSESRFLHLFTEQVGLPFRRYLKWKRLLDAVNAVSEGCNLTESAHLSGFSDSAHLSRVFREMIGFSPSKILQDSRFVQVIICD